MASFRPVADSKRQEPAPVAVASSAFYALCILIAVSLCCLFPVAASAVW